MPQAAPIEQTSRLRDPFDPGLRAHATFLRLSVPAVPTRPHRAAQEFAFHGL